jgi:four helix bundle protein
MKIERFEDIEAWQLARELARKVYRLTKKPRFATDYGLKRQIQEAAGSAMHNIAEGFDSETNAEFIRFLRYAKRSCTEVQSELYVALDEQYISTAEFQDVYEQARRARAAVRGFINYLKKYQTRINPKPLNEVQGFKGSTVQGLKPQENRAVNRRTREPLPTDEVPGFKGSTVQGLKTQEDRAVNRRTREPLPTVNPEPLNPEPLNREPLNREPLNPEL